MGSEEFYWDGLVEKKVRFCCRFHRLDVDGKEKLHIQTKYYGQGHYKKERKRPTFLYTSTAVRG